MRVPGLGMKVESCGGLLGLVSMASLAWRAAWIAGDSTLGKPDSGLRRNVLGFHKGTKVIRMFLKDIDSQHSSLFNDYSLIIINQ